MFRRLSGLGFVALAFSLACVAPGSVTPREIKGPFVWGSAPHVYWVRRIAVSSQPDEAGFVAAARQGVSVAIDLREPSERDWDESAVVGAAGIRYVSAPIPAAGPFPESSLARIEETISSNPEARVLVYCSSGNRAAGWLATHLATKHEMPLPDALDFGRRVGITKDAIAAKVSAYVAGHPGSAEPL